MELRVLGEVGAWAGNQAIEVGHARQRCVLAALLMNINQVLTVDQLIARVWAERLPRRPRQVLRGYLSRLRTVLSGRGVRIEWHASGYVLAMESDMVDVHRFHRLVGQARVESCGKRALAMTDEALALWRGEALAGLDTPWVNATREGLVRERFAAEADRIDLALAQGRHCALLAELHVRMTAHPLDERIAGQLMLALCRSGQQAEALRCYHMIRQRLAEDLGTDPGQPLRQLLQRILTMDPAVTSPAAEPARDSATVTWRG
jgi:DNA-binding SARP family transcriptional activator